MKIRELLEVLSHQGVELLVVDDSRIKLKAPRTALTPVLLEAVQVHKQALLELLRPGADIPRREARRCELSFAQEGIWFVDQSFSNRAVYNMPVSLRMKGRLRHALLEQALSEVVRRHEVLRTRFEMGDAAPVQVIADQAQQVIPISDIGEVPEGERLAYAEWLVLEEAQAPFDLRRGALLRARLIALAEGDHVFTLTVHHIIADRWSMGVMLQEIAACYRALAEDRQPQLPPLRIQYADYAQWERDFAASPVLGRQLSYWKDRLSGAPALLSLPTDRPRPEVQTHRGDCVRIVVPHGIAAALRHLAEERQCTLFMALAASFSLLLARYSGQNDVCIGTPVASRRRVETESLIGLLVNTLVLRTQIDLACSFDDLLKQVRSNALAAFSNQELPFEKLVEHLAPERDASYSPLFQAMLVLQNAPMESLELPELTLQRLDIAPQVAKFDLCLSLEETPAGLSGDLEYSTDLFNRATAERMAANFCHMLSSLVAQPGIPLHAVDLLDPVEQRRMLVDWNRTTRPYERDVTLHALFEAQAERSGAAMAVQFRNLSLSYQELNERANRLAHHLLGRGITLSTPIGLLVGPGLEMVVGMLAVLKAGAAYVPLDPAHPLDRLAAMVENAGAGLILTQDHLLSRVHFSGALLLSLDAQDAFTNEPCSNPAPLGTADDAAYVMHTSGSTGRPRGVRGTHRATVNRLRWLEDYAPPEADDIFCQKTTISFVDHVAEVFQPLLCGRPLLIVPAEEARDPMALARAIAAGQVTRLTVVPSLLSFLLEEAEASDLQSLRLLISSGEALTQDCAEKFYRLLPQARLINLYGSTEVGADATFLEVGAVRPNQEVMQYFVDAGKSEHCLALAGAEALDALPAAFGHAPVPQSPVSLASYAQIVNEQLAPTIVDVASARFIGHMTSRLPSFFEDISQLITRWNQNLVKLETSKGLTFLERQVLSSIHQLFFGLKDEHYAESCQDPAHVFGVVTSGGSTANITALLYARNRALLARGATAEQLSRLGYHDSLKALGFDRGVILGTRLLHYSVKKALSAFGIGSDSFVEVAQDADQRMSVPDLLRKIEVCRAQNRLVLAVVGIAGATETGTVDPLPEIAAVASAQGIHFHVDAAWGGAFQLSNRYKHKLAGIELADSITFCPHKQLFLPQGISLCLLRDTTGAAAVATHAAYQASKGSYDLGQYSLEGSRPANALLLHAGLHLLSRKGYAWLIEQSMEKARWLTRAIEGTCCFELVGGSPDLNIINYRYLPPHLRHRKGGTFSTAEHESISRAVDAIQKRQFADGDTFVSRTTLCLAALSDVPISVFRVVLSNPRTSIADIEAVLNDQIRIAHELAHSQLHPDTALAVHVDDDARWLVPIGQPIANCKVYVLDEWNQLLPQGAIGELCIGGDGLAKDYLGDAALTEAKFIRDPFSTEPGARLYKTGDLARWSQEGLLEYKGRRDFQVKIRGVRIELGEIESALRGCEGVREAVVVATAGPGGEARLVGYVVGEEGAALELEGMKQALQQSLPQYMVPQAVLVLEKLPLSPNGKVDRKALPQPQLEQLQEAYEAPQGETQQALARIWGELLGVEAARIGAQDNFFALGGHSLLAVRLVAQVRKVLGVELSIKELFGQASLQGLAEQVQAAGGRGTRSAVQAVVRGEGPLALSFAQQRLWFLDKLEGGSAHYNMPLALRVHGRFDVAVARQALQRIIDRHEPLRTVFESEDEQLRQQIREGVVLELQEQDLSGLDEPSQEKRVQALASEDAGRPFDLSQDLMVRASYLKLSEEEGVLLFNMHHIASDGWSMGLLVQEFVGQYEAVRQGQESPYEALGVQYADYAQWQRQWLQGPVLQEQLQYWERQLQGLAPVHSVPLDRARPVQQSYRGARHRFVVPSEVQQGLKRVAQEQQATLFMVLHAGLSVVLSRHGGSEDVVIGTPVANRLQKELEEIIGFFVNTLVLRSDVSGNPSFAELVQRVKEVNVQAQSQQDVPFEYLVEKLNPVRSTQYSPLFQIMLSLGMPQAGREAIGLGDVEFRVLEQKEVAAKFELLFEAQDEEDGLWMWVDYSTDLFDEATIKRLGEHYVRVLEQVAQGADKPIAELELLSEGERQYLVQELNQTHRAYEQDKCIHELFEEQVKRSPKSVAVSCEGQVLSYEALEEKANRLARYLRAQGVGPDKRVGLCVERSLEMVVGLLGVLKAGGAYVPLDPGYPQERLEYMLEDAQPVVVLTQQGVKERLGESGVPVLSLDSEWEERVQGYAGERLEPVAKAQDLAYVIYTSGSTGKPKGVMVEHRGLCNLSASQALFEITLDSRVLAFASLSFDAAAFEWIMALTRGAALHICTEQQRHDAQGLQVLLVEQGITHATLPPALLPHLDSGMSHRLQVLVLAGEGFAAELAQPWQARCRVFNAYGPTESSVWVSTAEIGPWAWKGIGKPIWNTQLYVLDERLEPVPVGVAGELHIGGVGVARGYLNREELTAQKFIRDPFAQDEKQRLYKTGDLARVLADGNIEYLGRLDDQVKIRGFRIELGEIESALRGCEGVREAVVVATAGPGGEARLVGYVVGEEGAALELEGMKQALQQSLPQYMVPQAVLVLEKLPLSPNGKVDRKALPQPQLEQLQEAYEAPQGETQQALARIWGELLGVEAARIGAQDNFFALGGHSLLAVRLVAQVRKVLGVELSIKELFGQASLQGLAEQVQAAGGRGTRSAVQAVVRGEGPLALSFAQQRLWFLDKLEGGSAHYNMPLALRVHGRFDVAVARQALQRIIDRHEPLRTVFESEDEQLRQQIREGVVLELQEQDLSGLDEPSQEKRVQALASEDAGRPFDLSQDLMVRASYLKLSEEEGVLLFNMHHIASDGWSMGLLVQEFVGQYEAVRQGQESPYEALGVQYADYAQWQRQWLQGPVLQEQLQYWERQLQGLAPVHSVPLDRARPVQQSYRGARHRFVVPSEVQQGLKRVAQEQQATLFMVLHAGLSVVLSRHGGSEDVVIGTPVANRLQKELEEIIGFFVNTLVLRSDVSGNPSFAELVQRVKEVNVQAQSQQDVPFEYLVEKLNPVRSTQYSPLFQIMLSLGMPQAGREAIGLGDVEFRVLEQKEVAAKFELLFEAQDEEDGLWMWVDYSTDLFDEATIKRLGEHYVRVLEQVAQGADKPIAELELLSEGERQYLVQELNQTHRAYEQDKCIHELFEEQVKRSPKSVAVSCEGQVLSYEALEEKANRLARYLRAQGVGPDKRVGLCVERSLEMVVGLLGVLKAGGAYVPLDPGYPQERLEYMLEDAQPVVVLTQQGVKERLGESGVPVLSLDSEWEERVQGYAGERLEPVAKAQDLAYVIYTSGSTGKPKGVMVEHRNVNNFLHAMRERPGIEASDVLLAVTPLSFDIAGLEIFLPLMVGAKVVIAPRAVVLDPQRLMQQMAAHGVSLMQATPSTWQMLVEHGWNEQERPLKLLCGGEALPHKLAEQLLQRVPRVWNMYGPTETTIWSTLSEVQGLEQGITIGRPIANTQTYVLDAQGEPVPLGVMGELYIGGDGVARGYVNRPELTQERFVSNPFGEAGARMYRTGDLARYREDGCLEYLGRLDDQVKVRGFRIELGEIENALRGCEGVREAVVVAKESITGDKQLVAYVVQRHPEESQQGSEFAQVLSTHLSSLLPEYMVPAAYVQIHALPLTPNGKLDRRALPEPDQDSMAHQRFAPPQGEVEQTLAAIWCKILGLKQVSRHDNFFALGGHSLLVARLIANAERNGLRLSYRVVIDFPTVKTLAAAALSVSVGTAALISQTRETSPRGGQTSRLWLTYGQYANYWRNEKVNPSSRYYNIAVAFFIEGVIDVDRLEMAVNEVMCRHDALRSRVLCGKDGRPYQVTPRHRWRSLSPIEIPSEQFEDFDFMHDYLQSEALSPFHLSTGPKCRFRLVTSPERTRSILAITVHHAFSDGESMRIILRDLGEAYSSDERFRGRSKSLPQFSNFARRQERLTANVPYELGGFWSSYLKKPWPIIFKQEESISGVGELFQKLDFDVQDFLHASSELQVTPFTIAMTALKRALSILTGVVDICVETPFSLRTEREDWEVVGRLTEIHVVRTIMNGEDEPIVSLEKVRNSLADVSEHQHLPLPFIKKNIIGEDYPRISDIRLLFSMASDENVLNLKGLNVVQLNVKRPNVIWRRTGLVELTVGIGPDGGGLEMLFSKSLLNGTAAQRLADAFAHELKLLLCLCHSHGARQRAGDRPSTAPALI